MDFTRLRVSQYLRINNYRFESSYIKNVENQQFQISEFTPSVPRVDKPSYTSSVKSFYISRRNIWNL